MGERYELRMTSSEAVKILSGILDNCTTADMDSIKDAISSLLYLYTNNESSKVEAVLSDIEFEIDEMDIPSFVETEDDASIWVKSIETINSLIDKYILKEKHSKNPNI